MHAHVSCQQVCHASIPLLGLNLRLRSCSLSLNLRLRSRSLSLNLRLNSRICSSVSRRLLFIVCTLFVLVKRGERASRPVPCGCYFYVVLRPLTALIRFFILSTPAFRSGAGFLAFARLLGWIAVVGSGVLTLAQTFQSSFQSLPLPPSEK